MLRKKLFRDLRQNLSQFFVIFMMVFLSVMVFAGVHAYMDGMRVSSEEIYSEYNLADMWLTSEGFSEEELETVRANDNVTAADRKLTIQLTPDGMEDVTLEINIIEGNDVCSMYVFDGEAFDPESTNGLWLDKEFADARGLKVGDSITVSYEIYSVETVIKGLVRHRTMLTVSKTPQRYSRIITHSDMPICRSVRCLRSWPDSFRIQRSWSI